jgi:hypothetical protein
MMATPSDLKRPNSENAFYLGCGQSRCGLIEKQDSSLLRHGLDNLDKLPLTYP